MKSYAINAHICITINPDKLAMRIKRKSNNRLAVPGFDSFAKEFRGNELIHQQCINLQTLHTRHPSTKIIFQYRKIRNIAEM